MTSRGGHWRRVSHCAAVPVQTFGAPGQPEESEPIHQTLIRRFWTRSRRCALTRTGNCAHFLDDGSHRACARRQADTADRRTPTLSQAVSDIAPHPADRPAAPQLHYSCVSSSAARKLIRNEGTRPPSSRLPCTQAATSATAATRTHKQPNLRNKTPQTHLRTGGSRLTCAVSSHRGGRKEKREQNRRPNCAGLVPLFSPLHALAAV